MVGRDLLDTLEDNVMEEDYFCSGRRKELSRVAVSIILEGGRW